MIKVSFFYPNKENAKFDHDYFVNKHMPFGIEKQKPLGLLRFDIDKGVASGVPGVQAPYVAIGHLFFDSIEKFQNSMEKVGGELIADLPNFTDIEPVVQISEVLANEILT